MTAGWEDDAPVEALAPARPPRAPTRLSSPAIFAVSLLAAALWLAGLLLVSRLLWG